MLEGRVLPKIWTFVLPLMITNLLQAFYNAADMIVIVPTNGAVANFAMGSEVNLTFGGNVAHVFSKETGENLEW